jgi:hypothetical protein
MPGMSGLELRRHLAEVQRGSTIVLFQDTRSRTSKWGKKDEHRPRNAADVPVADQTLIDPAKPARHTPQPFGEKMGWVSLLGGNAAPGLTPRMSWPRAMKDPAMSSCNAQPLIS